MQQYADLELSLHRYQAGIFTVGFRYVQPGSDTDTGLGQGDPVRVRIDHEAKDFYPTVFDPLKYGRALTDALFSDQALKIAFARATTSAKTQNIPLRVRLWIGPGAPELHNLRWELLCDPVEYTPLATNENTYFSRYLSSADWRPVRLQSRGNLKALVVVANPKNLDDYELAMLDSDAEFARARQGLGDIDADYLPTNGKNASAENIVGALRNGADILLLIAHGAFVKGRPVLYLEDEHGRIMLTYGDDLVLRIKELQKLPRLVLLLSCQSAGKGEGEALSAMGPRLVEAGVPAVIAMQDNLSIETSEEFLPLFFRSLQEDGQIDHALAVARGGIREQPDAWVPVLFMRSKSGRLWYTPGFSSTSSSTDFTSEVRYIVRQRCTPILGPGMIESVVGSSRDIARIWAETYNYPMAPYDRDALPKVAQYLATDKGDAMPYDEYEDFVRKAMTRNFREVLPPDTPDRKFVELDELTRPIGAHLRDKDPNDPYRILAKIPFPIYIVATPDRLLEDALEAEGRSPETMLSPWNSDLAQRKTVFDHQPSYEPSPERPLVFYLFGRWNERSSMVLSEDEYIKYLIGFTSNKAFIPESIKLALSDTLLLFLGFQTEEWAFRVIFHSILAQAGSELLGQYAHIAAQIEPDDERTLEPLRARRYLEKYFIKGANINIFWGRAEDYLAGLFQAWEAQA